MSNTKTYLKEASCDLLIEFVDDVREYTSAEINLCDIPWKIKIIHQRKDNNEIVIEAVLTLSPLSNNLASSKWTCDANATVSIRSFATNQQFNETSIPRTQFSNNCLCSQPVEVIRAASLEQYKNNNYITFHVQLVANPVFYATPHQIDHSLANFQFEVENVSQLDETGKFSPEIKVRGTTWKVKVLKRENLRVYLWHTGNNVNENWLWKVKCSVALLSFNKAVDSINKNFARDFCSGHPNWGFASFISWDKFMDPANEYVRNDKAVFEVCLEVEPPKPLWNFEERPSNVRKSECSICLQDIMSHEPAATKCGRLFCNSCIRAAIGEHKKCRNCNAVAKLNEIRNFFL